MDYVFTHKATQCLWCKLSVSYSTGGATGQKHTGAADTAPPLHHVRVHILLGKNL